MSVDALEYYCTQAGQQLGCYLELDLESGELAIRIDHTPGTRTQRQHDGYLRSWQIGCTPTGDSGAELLAQVKPLAAKLCKESISVSRANGFDSYIYLGTAGECIEFEISEHVADWEQWANAVSQYHPAEYFADDLDDIKAALAAGERIDIENTCESNWDPQALGSGEIVAQPTISDWLDGLEEELGE